MTLPNTHGFGRRKPVQRDDVVANPSPSLANVAAHIRAPSGALFGGLFKGVGFLLLVAAVYVAAMKGFGRALDQHWRTNVGFPDVEAAYQRNGPADATFEAAHNDCKSRSDFAGLDKRSRRAFEGYMDLSAGENQLAKAALYVSCLTAHQPARFCQPAHRSHLSAALQDYYKLMARVREERMMAMSGPFAGEKAMLMGTPGARAAVGPMPSEKTDARIVAGLRDLIEQGYLARRDLSGMFGSMPGDLETALHGVAPKRQGCA